MDADVTVVGAGPVGLLLAAELALGGVSTLVLERLDAPDETIKAGSISVPSAAALDRRGLLGEAERVQRETLARVMEFLKTGGMPTKAGHFAGLMLDRSLVDDADPDLGAQPSASGATLVPQRELEAVLAEHAARLGVPVRRGVAVTGLREEAGAVVVDTHTGPVRSAYVVGCDGGRSLVRHEAGIAFPGTDAELTGHQAIVDVADPEVLEKGWNRTPTGVYCHGPLPGRILTVEFDGPPADRDAPVTLDELQASLRRTSGTGVTLTALHGAGTRWTDNARQAQTYRRGRVLLAGDAAHVHSPFSGQGLNLGIGDACNLGWKLAAVVRGDAPDTLLDTYTAERHPIGARVLEWTRAQVALMRPDPKTAALRDVVADLMSTREGMTHVVRTIAGVTQRLDLPGGHPLVGTLAPELVLADGTRLPDHAHDGGFVLLDRTPDGTYAALAGDRVTVVVDGPGDPAAMLVRPDGVVAWAVRTEGDDDVAGLESALCRWVGAPAAVAAA